MRACVLSLAHHWISVTTLDRVSPESSTAGALFAFKQRREMSRLRDVRICLINLFGDCGLRCALR